MTLPTGTVTFLLTDVEGSTRAVARHRGVLPEEQGEGDSVVVAFTRAFERDLDIYKSLSRHHDGTLGVWTQVQEPGTVRVGDPVVVS